MASTSTAESPLTTTHPTSYIDDLQRLVLVGVRVIEGDHSDQVYVVLSPGADTALAEQTARAIEQPAIKQFREDYTRTALAQQRGEVTVLAEPITTYLEPVDLAQQWQRAAALSVPVSGHFDEALLVPATPFLRDNSEHLSGAACADHLAATQHMFQDPAIPAVANGQLELHFGSARCGRYRVFINTLHGEQEPKIRAAAELLRHDLDLPGGTLLRVGPNGQLSVVADELAEAQTSKIDDL